MWPHCLWVLGWPKQPPPSTPKEPRAPGVRLCTTCQLMGQVTPHRCQVAQGQMATPCWGSPNTERDRQNSGARGQQRRGARTRKKSRSELGGLGEPRAPGPGKETGYGWGTAIQRTVTGSLQTPLCSQQPSSWEEGIRKALVTQTCTFPGPSTHTHRCT